MSQTTTPAPSIPAPPGTPASAPIKASRRSRWRAELDSTPGKLRFVAALAVLAALAFALLGGAGYLLWSNNINAARDDAAQLVRVQTIQNELMKADASASNAYLAGGVESADSRQGYDEAMLAASQGLAEVAAANPKDAVEASTITGAIVRYAQQVELAKGANRQHLLVGAAYQRAAGDILRFKIVPALDRLTAADRRRVDDGYMGANRATGVLSGGAVLAIGGGLLAQWWLARRTHRYLNLPAATGTAIIVLATGVGIAVLSMAASAAGDVGRHSYVATAALAEARTKAYDAKAREALTLIARGSDSKKNEDSAVKDISFAQSALERAVGAGADKASVQAMNAWAEVHKSIRKADDGGDWLAAKGLATGLGVTSSNNAFESFDTASSSALSRQAKLTTDGLASAGRWLAWMGGLSILAGIVAALAAWAGFAQRWEEYR
jgi:hypothetical protein